MSAFNIQFQILRRKHGLTEAAARIVATLYFGEGR